MHVKESAWISAVWRDAKRWRHIPLGPIRMTFKFGRRPAKRSLLDPKDAASPRSGETGRRNKREERAAGCAVVVGVGPGLGHAAARSLAERRLPVALVSRSHAALEAQARELAAATGGSVQAHAADATDEREVARVVSRIESTLGPIDLLIYAIQSSTPGSVLTTEVAAFEESWRANCLGAFVVGREVARRMVPRASGTVIFCGATSGTVGRKGYVNLAIGKFGLRALAQVMARELGPLGVHVVHVIIDADIAEGDVVDGEPHTQPDELAELFWSLHRQPKSCWTSELDVRPSDEVFWEHC